MSEPTLPPMPDSCWPVDTTCLTNWEDYPPAVQAFAEAMAGQTLRALTGYQVGGCPITVRPCLRGCEGSSYLIAPVWQGSFPGAWMSPHIGPSGGWVNSCGCQGDCSCSSLCEVRLAAPVGEIVEVLLDGVELDPLAYRVDDGNLLTRVDGGCWPSCQDMAADCDSEGAFCVTYLNAHPVDGLGAVAAGVLAGEFAKACSGKACSLPRGVTEISRQGVTFSVSAGVFPDGLTGLTTADAFIRRWNPHTLKLPPRVYSPDLRNPRRTTLP